MNNLTVIYDNSRRSISVERPTPESPIDMRNYRVSVEGREVRLAAGEIKVARVTKSHIVLEGPFWKGEGEVLVEILSTPPGLDAIPPDWERDRLVEAAVAAMQRVARHPHKINPKEVAARLFPEVGASTPEVVASVLVTIPPEWLEEERFFY